MAISVFDWPLDEWAVPARIEWGLLSPSLTNTSTLTGAAQSIDAPFARWSVTMKFNHAYNRDQARREALFAKLRGQFNRVNLFHHGRETPSGNYSGSRELAAGASQFAQSFSITATGGETLLAGDMIGVGGQLYMVTDDTSESGGTIAVNVAPRIRATQPSAAPVTIIRPTTQFMMTSAQVLVPTEPTASPGFAASFLEAFV